MKFMSLIYFVLSLFGCDIGSSTYVTRNTIDGTDTLYSQATTQAGVARFECLRSASGACHYTVFPRECPSTAKPAAKPAAKQAAKQANLADTGCAIEPLQSFTVASGESRQLTGLRDFRLCVSVEDGAPEQGCGLPEAMAKQ